MHEPIWCTEYAAHTHTHVSRPKRRTRVLYFSLRTRHALHTIPSPLYPVLSLLQQLWPSARHMGGVECGDGDVAVVHYIQQGLQSVDGYGVGMRKVRKKHSPHNSVWHLSVILRSLYAHAPVSQCIRSAHHEPVFCALVSCTSENVCA